MGQEEEKEEVGGKSLGWVVGSPTCLCGPRERLLPWGRSELYIPKKVNCPGSHRNQNENIYRISEKTEKLRGHD